MHYRLTYEMIQCWLNDEKSAQEWGATLANATSVDLSNCDLYKISIDGIKTIFTAMPAGLSTLDLNGNNLGNKPLHGLIHLVRAMPNGLTSLNLSNNDLDAPILEGLIRHLVQANPNLVALNLSKNNLQHKSDTELNYIFDESPPAINVTHDASVQIKHSLYQYMSTREELTNSLGETKEYRFSGVFSIFQKSLTQKREAVDALKTALNGEATDLSKHLSTLRNGDLGKKLRTFVKSGMADELVGRPVTTVRDFITALERRNSQLQMN